MLLVDEALREIDTMVHLFVASRPLAIHISNLQCIAIFAVPLSSGSFLSVLFIVNWADWVLSVWILSLLGLTRPFLSVLFITNVRILSLLGLTRPIPQSFPILLLRSESLVFFVFFLWVSVLPLWIWLRFTISFRGLMEIFGNPWRGLSRDPLRYKKADAAGRKVVLLSY